MHWGQWDTFSMTTAVTDINKAPTRLEKYSSPKWQADMTDDDQIAHVW